MRSSKLHKRHKSATTENNNLSERLVVKFKYILLKVFLGIFRCSILVNQFAVFVDFKCVWFDSTEYPIVVSANTKADLNLQSLFVNTINKLGFVDFTKWFIE